MRDLRLKIGPNEIVAGAFALAYFFGSMYLFDLYFHKRGWGTPYLGPLLIGIYVFQYCYKIEYELSLRWFVILNARFLVFLIPCIFVTLILTTILSFVFRFSNGFAMAISILLIPCLWYAFTRALAAKYADDSEKPNPNDPRMWTARAPRGQE